MSDVITHIHGYHVLISHTNDIDNARYLSNNLFGYSECLGEEYYDPYHEFNTVEKFVRSNKDHSRLIVMDDPEFNDVTAQINQLDSRSQLICSDPRFGLPKLLDHYDNSISVQSTRVESDRFGLDYCVHCGDDNPDMYADDCSITYHANCLNDQVYTTCCNQLLGRVSDFDRKDKNDFNHREEVPKPNPWLLKGDNIFVITLQSILSAMRK